MRGAPQGPPRGREPQPQGLHAQCGRGEGQARASLREPGPRPLETEADRAPEPAIEFVESLCVLPQARAGVDVGEPLPDEPQVGPQVVQPTPRREKDSLPGGRNQP